MMSAWSKSMMSSNSCPLLTTGTAPLTRGFRALDGFQGFMNVCPHKHMRLCVTCEENVNLKYYYHPLVSDVKKQKADGVLTVQSIRV